MLKCRLQAHIHCTSGTALLLTFKANLKSKVVRSDDADSRLKAFENVASKELFGEMSPRGILADPLQSKLVSIDPVSLGFKLLPDDPSF
jgi:hypothetical protein